MQFRFARSLVALGLLAAAPVGAQTPTADDLARSLQKRYATIRDFTADFTHEVQGGVLRTLRTTESGELKVKKPGRLWMSYGPPQKKSFVADGSRLYTYVAADRTGTEGPMPAGDDLSVAILFLAGRGDLVKDFRAALPAAQSPDAPPDDEWYLILTPIRRQEDFATLTLHVDRRTLALRGLTTVDHQGGTFVFRFTNLRENVGLKDSDFHFKFPNDARIIHAGRVR